MRVALVAHQFFPANYTGVERLTLNLARQLQRMGHECTVFTAAEHASGTEAPYTVQGIAVQPLRVGSVNGLVPWVDPSRLAGRLRRAMLEQGPDLVHVMHPARMPMAFAVAGELRLPVVAHVADFWFCCPRVVMLRVDGERCFDAHGGRACARACGIPVGPRRLSWCQRVLAGASAVIVPCRATAEIYSRQGFDVAGWEHVPWGVDYALHPARLPPPRNPRVTVGFIGTLLPHKGSHTLVEAVQQLEPGLVDCHVWGESFDQVSYERELKAKAAGNPSIVFAGRYTHEEFRSVLEPLDAVVVPSLWHENLPTAALNAVAAGVPIIASDVPGLRELVEDYRCGWLFPPGDAAALAELLTSLCADRSRVETTREGMLYPPSLEEEAWRITRIYDSLTET